MKSRVATYFTAFVVGFATKLEHEVALMRHALWIVVLVAACGRDGTAPAPTSTDQQKQQEVKGAVLLPRDAQQLRAVRTAKGTQLKLDGNFESAAMVRRAADGSLQTECFDEAQDAEAFMANTSTARTAEVQ